MGSVSELTDPQGSVQATYSYGAFGETTVSQGAPRNPFAYTGQYFDGGSPGVVANNEYNLRAREYDTETGRFLQKDPLGGGYVYGKDNPMVYRDPSGKEASGCHSWCTFRELPATVKDGFTPNPPCDVQGYVDSNASFFLNTYGTYTDMCGHIDYYFGVTWGFPPAGVSVTTSDSTPSCLSAYGQGLFGKGGSVGLSNERFGGEGKWFGETGLGIPQASVAATWSAECVQ